MAELTAKQEKFCQCITEGINQSDAYRKAYNAEKMKPETIHVRAAELMRNSKIEARIKELRAPVIAECRLTLYNHLQALEQLRDLAKDAGTFAAAIRAEELRGKVSGLYTDRIEHTGNVDLKALLDEITATDDSLLGEGNQVGVL